MSDLAEQIDKKKCSDCSHYQKVEISGKKQVFQCVNPMVFKDDQSASHLGYINANIARRFLKYCSSNATYFAENITQEIAANDENSIKSKSGVLRYFFGSDKEDIVIATITKMLIVTVVSVIALSTTQLI